MFDYIIIGAGTSGCVLANRLSENKDVSVLVIEAGGSDKHPFIAMPMGFLKIIKNPKYTFQYMSEPEPHMDGRQIPIPRGKVLGGSSSVNGMLHIRGHKAGYDEWRDAGCEGWGFDDLLPYFKKFENNWRGENEYHSASGPIEINPIDTKRLVFEPLQQSSVNAGFGYTDDYDGENPIGLARGDVTINKKGRRNAAAKAFLHPAMKRPNLKVITNARTHRVLLENGKAIGVEYSINGEIKQVKAKHEIILCAGAYNTPQILMLSGIGPEEELKKFGIAPQKIIEGVGRNLMEHPRYVVRYKASKPVSYVGQLRFDKATLSVLEWAFLGTGPFSTQINTATVLLKTKPELSRPDIQLLCSPIALEAELWFPFIRKPIDHFFSVSVCLLNEKSRGSVGLKSANPFDNPKINLNFFENEDDLKTMRDGIKAVRKIFETAPQSELIEIETIPGSDAQSDEDLNISLRKETNLTHHPVGTCKMGIDEMAVVDPQLRVRGVSGLRIADASIMPNIPGANTMAACLMIGEKAADLIKQ